MECKYTAWPPVNTTYRRDLSVSYERLAVMATNAGDAPQGVELLNLAVAARRHLNRQEPSRADLAEEMAVALYLLATVRDAAEGVRLSEEIVDLLRPFERDGVITRKGRQILQILTGS